MGKQLSLLISIISESRREKCHLWDVRLAHSQMHHCACSVRLEHVQSPKIDKRIITYTKICVNSQCCHGKSVNSYTKKYSQSSREEGVFDDN